MKRVFLLIVLSALLGTLGFAQTPSAGSNTDQVNVKGCLGGSDGNYTVVEDGTRQIFKITTSSVDLKPHLGHDVQLTGTKANGAVSSGASDNSFAVTELNMISEHCAAAAAAPAATVTTPAANPAAPAATVSPSTVTVTTPATPPAAPAAETVSPSSATVIAPPMDPMAPAATVGPSSDTVSKPVVDGARPTRRSAHARRIAATQTAAATTPAAMVSPSSDTVSPPAATTTLSSGTVSAPAAAATTPTVAHRGSSLWLLILLAVLVIGLAALVPRLGRWRKRKILERTGTQNLSFTNADRDKPEARKVA